MRVAAALALLTLASCSGSDPEAAKLEIEQLVKAYHRAYDSAEADAVLAMLDPDVSIPNPPSSFFRGRESCGAELRKGMERIRAQDKIGKRNTYLGDIRTTVEGSMAVSTYEAHVSEVGGPPAKTIFTRVFRRSDKKWLILSEHYTFAPDK